MRRHVRFLVAFGFGTAIWFAAQASPLDGAMQAVLAVNGFFVAYLAMMLQLTLISSADTLLRYAEVDDEGSVLILVLAVGALAVSLASIFSVLNRTSGTLLDSAFALAAAARRCSPAARCAARRNGAPSRRG